MTFLKKVFKPNINKMIREGDYESILELLSHEDQKVQFEAVQAIGKAGDPRAADILLEFLDDGISMASIREIHFLAQVCNMLGELGVQDGIPLMRGLLQEMESPDVLEDRSREWLENLEVLELSAGEAIRKIETSQ